jgi:beta-N-acetylhexosaminidase
VNPWLVCGITGLLLQPSERRLLEDLGPGGVILFLRNIHDLPQLVDLVAELRGLPSRPYVAIDLEGGRVNRLAKLYGPLPAPARAAAAGPDAVMALGRALGAACASLGITADYAPVVDVAHPTGYVGGEGRCLGGDADAVTAAAAPFLEGIESFGVATCLKHFPGLGSGSVDSHKELPLLDDSAAADEAAFLALARPERAVMVAHAMAPSLGEPYAPASLSATVVGRITGAPCGPLIADDLEMGALARHGTLGERAAAALSAGCHQVLVCNAMDGRAAVAEHVQRHASPGSPLAVRLADAAARCAPYGQGPLARVGLDEALALCRAACDAVGGVS